MELRGECVALEQLRLQRGENIVANLLLVATTLADQVVMGFAMNILIVQWPIPCRDRRDQSNLLKPLECAIDRRNIDIWMPLKNRVMDVLSCQVFSAAFHNFQHHQALGGQPVLALLPKCSSIIAVSHIFSCLSS